MTEATKRRCSQEAEEHGEGDRGAGPQQQKRRRGRSLSGDGHLGGEAPGAEVKGMGQMKEDQQGVAGTHGIEQGGEGHHPGEEKDGGPDPPEKETRRHTARAGQPEEPEVE
jgi:hypothetical protein